MNTTIATESKIVGEFVGYRPGRVYRLADGTVWRQEDQQSEDGVFRISPSAKILWEQASGRSFLEIEGAARTVRVVRWYRSYHETIDGGA